MRTRMCNLVRLGASAAVVAAAGLAVLAPAGTAGASSSSSSSSSALAQAKKHVLTLSAMPKGWTVEPGSKYSTGGSNDLPGPAELASCVGVAPGLAGSYAPEGDSPYYQNGDGSLEVQDAVMVFPSARKAHSAYATMASAKVSGCAAGLLNDPTVKAQMVAGAGKGSSIGTVTATGYPPINGHTAAYTVTLPLTAQGSAVTVATTLVFTVKGKLLQQISFTSYGGPFPRSVITRVTGEATKRL